MRKRPLDGLISLVAKLRSPRGCPWDRKQTHLSLIKYLHEEARELAAALRGGDAHEIEDELGDVLLQVLLHAEIARERGLFDIHDVARAQYLKLRRRHPHVFGDRRFKTAEDVLANWAEIKSGERKLRARDIRRKARAAALALLMPAFALRRPARAEEAPYRMAPHLARITPDGSLLPPLPGAGTGFDGDVHVLLPQPDGKMLVLGEFNAYGTESELYGIARLNPDGTLDAGFRKRASKPLSERGRYDCAVVLRDWRVALGGFFTTYGGHPSNGLALLSPRGGMDKIFLDNTLPLTTVTNEGTGLRVRTIAPAPHDRFLVAGDFDYRPALFMLEPDGKIQRHFQAPPSYRYFAGLVNDARVLLATLPDGKILLAGTYRPKDGDAVGRVVRLLADGSEDRTFSAPEFHGNDRFFRVMLVEKDGSILLGGSFDSAGEVKAPNLARLDRNGRLDEAFLRRLGGGFGEERGQHVRALLRLKDGSLIAGGAFGLGRLRPDGRPDVDFSRNVLYGLNGQVDALALGPDGSIWVGGSFSGVLDPKLAAPAWNRCKVPEDCRPVQLPCGDWEFSHKLYVEEIAALHRKRRAAHDCVFLDRPSPPPACAAGVCRAKAP